MSSDDPHIGVIGAGAWGTALAMLANRAGSRATIWTRNEQVIESLNARRENAQYLPEIFVDPAIAVTNDMQALAKCDALIMTIPAQSVRTVTISLSDIVTSNVPIIIASKGIERGSLMLMWDPLESTCRHASLSIL